MKIVEIRSAVAVVPLTKPVSWATAAVTEREYILVWAIGDDGSFGLGYGLGSRYPGGAKLFHEIVQEQLSPLVVGSDSWMTEDIWSRSYQRTLLLGRRGAALRAMSAIDIALWDLNAKLAGVPLYRLLGGYRSRVPVYASGGYYSTNDHLSDIESEITAYLARGFDAVKIKVGGQPLAVDVARVRLARELIGPEGRLALDANNAWSSLPDAQRAADRFAPYDPWWLEEPFLPDAAANFSELSKRTSIPLATGELEATRWPFRQFLDERSVHILQPDATVCGGVTEWRRIAQMAAGFDVPVAPHWAPEIHSHLVAASPNGLAVEYFTPDRDIVNFDRLVANPLKPAGGWLQLSESSGHGLVLDNQQVLRHIRHDSHASAPLPEYK
ncbi:mandelate racemase/muconate lactonizing enzyme family protein [soil metagenome]